MNLEHRSNLPHSGPLGPIARTAEHDNNDAADNRDTYYLRDGMGGHTGLLTDEDDNLATPQRFSFSTYDAFGNHMSPGRPPSQGGSFTWRGAEGSVYDSHPTLVYMQARHYDPTIGRFIQPDSLPLASMTTQGMNRYIYCENDPVNFSDATGQFLLPLLAAGLLGGVLGWAFNRSVGGFVGGFIAGIIMAVAAALYPGLGFLAFALGASLSRLVMDLFAGKPCTIALRNAFVAFVIGGFCRSRGPLGKLRFFAHTWLLHRIRHKCSFGPIPWLCAGGGGG